MDEVTQTPGEISTGSPTAPSEHDPSRLNGDAVARAFSEAAREQEAPVTENASGSDTPAATEPANQEPATVPSYRLREETAKRRELEDRFNPWADTLSALSEMGYTPEQIRQALQNPATPETEEPRPQAHPEPAASPEADIDFAFEAHLRQQGIDPYLLNADAYGLRKELWDTRQMFTQQQATAQAERQQAEAQQQAMARSQRWEADVEALKGRYPKLPQLQTVDGQLDLIASYQARHGHEPNRAQFEAYLDRSYVQPLQSLIEAEKQAYAAAKAGDSAVPSTSGGSSVPASDRVDFHSLKASEQERALTAATRQLMGTT